MNSHTGDAVDYAWETLSVPLTVSREQALEIQRQAEAQRRRDREDLKSMIEATQAYLEQPTMKKCGGKKKGGKKGGGY